MSKFHCKKIEPDWEGACDACSASPIVPRTGMCGPCTWGEADTVMGNWESITTERCDDCDGTCMELKQKSD
jgi:hypothetical protein